MTTMIDVRCISTEPPRILCVGLSGSGQRLMAAFLYPPLKAARQQAAQLRPLSEALIAHPECRLVARPDVQAATGEWWHCPTFSPLQRGSERQSFASASGGGGINRPAEFLKVGA
jgi:hypothetical protein